MVRIGPVTLAAALALLGVGLTRPAHGQDPGAAACFLADRNGSLLDNDPALLPPEAPMGWFGALSMEVVAPAIKQAVRGDVQLGPDTFTVFVPRTELDWIGAPRIEVGYRFGGATGELLADYRFLATEGTRDVPAPDGVGTGRLRSRLDFQLLWLDYASHEFSLAPFGAMKTFAGVCLPSIYFDNEVRGSLSTLRTSNYYFGAGPHLGMEFWFALPQTGLEAYARIDGVITVGKNHQEYHAVLPMPDGTLLGGDASVRAIRESPALRSVLGLSYTPPWASWVHFDLGYTIERWWYVGQTSTEDLPSRGEVTVQGVFLRGEWSY